MPAYRFPFAVRVSCENQGISTFDRFRDVFDAAFGIPIHHPKHVKAVVGINRPITWGQVADVTITCEHMVVAAEVFVDRLRLSRRLNHNNFGVLGHREKGSLQAVEGYMLWRLGQGHGDYTRNERLVDP